MHNKIWGRLRHPHPKGGKAAIFVGFVTMLILGLLTLFAGNASADPTPNTQQCVTTAHGDLCSTPSVDNAAGTVTVTNHATGLTTNPVQAHLTAGSYTAADFTTEQNPVGTYDDAFTFTPPPGVTTATVEITGPTGHSFDPAILVTVAWEFDTPTTQSISAKALSNHECNAAEWHFVINQVDTEDDAPASIHVTWANGQSADVPLDQFTGGVAHYTTTANLDSTVTSATAEIYAGWSGQFNLSHGPCGGNNSSSVPPTSTPPKSSSTPPPPPTTVTDNCPQFCSTATSTHHNPPPGSNTTPPSAGAHTGRTGLPLWPLEVAMAGLLGLAALTRKKWLPLLGMGRSH